jgi:hypothetical protein
MWQGEGEDEGGTPYGKAEIARDAFHPESAVLVGKLDNEQPAGCGTGSLARHASLPAITAFEWESSASGALREAAIAAFRTTKTHQEIQKDFRSSPEGAAGGHWDEFVDPTGAGDDSGPRVEEFRRGDTVLVLVQASVGVGCGQYEASLSTLFKVDESSKRPTFVLQHETWSPYTAVEVHDIGTESNPASAGQVVLLVRDRRGLDRALVTLDGDELRSMRVPYFECDC